MGIKRKRQRWSETEKADRKSRQDKETDKWNGSK